MSRERGHTMVEFLVSLGVLALIMSAAGPLLIDNARVNKSKHMAMATQAAARNALTMISAQIRSGGWDPKGVGFPRLGIDPDPNGTDNYIVVFGDFNADGDLLDPGESVTIRHNVNRIEWRMVADPNVPFQTIAENITNDENGDGLTEHMFTPDSTTNPKRVTVRITARSPEPDPITRTFYRYTLSNDIILRDSL